MKTVSAKELRQLMERDKDLLVLNVLSHDDYAKEHISGSENVPEDTPDFRLLVQRLAGSRNRPIVVHCASTESHASEEAARKLEEAGFTNVSRFPGGLAEWEREGYPLQSMTAGAVTDRHPAA